VYPFTLPRLPLAFTGNDGEFDPGRVKYFYRGAGSAFLARPDGLVLWLRGKSQQSGGRAPAAADLDLSFMGAGPGHRLGSGHRVSGVGRLPGVVNSFTGSRPDQWHTGAPLFGGLSYTGLWRGVNLTLRGSDGALEEDLKLAGGTRPESIRLDFSHQQRAGVDRAGNLVFSVGGRDVLQSRPTAAQAAGRGSRAVGVRYALLGGGLIGLKLGAYDHRQPLEITAQLSYPTQLTPTSDAGGEGVAVDSSGSVYVAGNIGSAQFPSPGPKQATRAALPNAFVAKLNPAGTRFEYITYVGGDAYDLVSGIAVDARGSAYVTGVTDSTDFPTRNAVQGKLNGATDAFVFKLAPAGNALAYSTYLGGRGTEQGGAIAVDPAGNTYVTGLTRSTDFPVTPGVVQTHSGGGAADAFVAKIDPVGNRLVYSTYLGGRGDDEGGGIAADAAGNAYVTGVTDSPDFPVHSALQADKHGGTSAFVTKLNPSGTALAYSTYLGGSGSDSGSAIAIDQQGAAYVAVNTTSPDLPTHQAFQSRLGGGTDAFVARLNPAGSGLDYATYLGGSGDDHAGGIAVDAQRDAYITGNTRSTDFPTRNALQGSNIGGEDGFMTKLDGSGSLLFSSYFGQSGSDSGNAIAVDPAGTANITGETDAAYLPAGNPLQPALGSASSAFLLKIDAAAQSSTPGR
jgi:hypothetical protein